MPFLLLHLIHTHPSRLSHLLAPPLISHLPSPPPKCFPLDIFPFAPLLPPLPIAMYKSAWQGTPLLVTPSSHSLLPPFHPCPSLSHGNMMLLYINKKPLIQHRIFFSYLRLSIRKGWAEGELFVTRLLAEGTPDKFYLFAGHPVNKSILNIKRETENVWNRFGTELIMNTS